MSLLRFIAELDCHWDNDTHGPLRLMAICDTEEEAREAMDVAMKERGLVVGQNCFAPVYRRHLDLTQVPKGQ